MVTREEVIDRLKTVFDPEIPVNIWDLGLIYKIDIQDGCVKIAMTLTSEHCPAAKELPEKVRASIAQLGGVSEMDVQVVWEPKWSPELINPEGKKILDIE